MELTNVEITKAKFTLKSVKVDYYNNLDGQNYSVESGEYPHPDLIIARDELKQDLAYAFFLDNNDADRFTVNGFIIDEGDGITTVKLTGQFTNSYEYLTNVNSGKIPLDEEREDLKVLIETLKTELFKFFFESKHAQGKLEGFPANGAEEQSKGLTSEKAEKEEVEEVQN